MGLSFHGNFDLHIRYALLPVQSLIVNLQSFALDDDIDFTLNGADRPKATLLLDAPAL